MRFVRNLLLPLLLIALIFGVSANSAVAAVTAVTYVDRPDGSDAGTDGDTATISANSNGVWIAAFQVTNGAVADRLENLWLYSYNQHSFSATNYKIYHKIGNTGVEVLKRQISTLSTKFETGDEITLTNVNIDFAINAVDTVIIRMDVLKDSVNAHPLGYDGQGVQVSIKPGKLDFLSGFAGAYTPTELMPTNFNPATQSSYWVHFDTRPPIFTVDVERHRAFWTDSTYWGYVSTCGNLATGPIALGDSIMVKATFPTATNRIDSIDVSTLKVLNGNWGSFVSPSTTTDRLMDTLGGWMAGAPPNAIARAAQRIPYPLSTVGQVVRVPTDFPTNYPIVVQASDRAGNVGVDTFWFSREVDTKKPKFDSIKVALWYDGKGDGAASVGDTLAITAYMISNPAFEVQKVAADLSNFVVPYGAAYSFHDSLRYLEDISLPNNNTIWRLKVPLDLARHDRDIKGNSTNADTTWMRTIWLAAWDNSCNIDTGHVRWDADIDLDPPQFSLFNEYKVQKDYDTNTCVDYGDSIWVKANVWEDPNVDSVFADFIAAGINRTDRAMLYDDATHSDATSGDKYWTRGYRIGNRWALTAEDPLPADAKDANGDTPPANDNDYTILVTAVDKHGNRDTIRLILLDVNGSPAASLDTKRPKQLLPSGIRGTAQGGTGAGRIKVSWPVALKAADAAVFRIFDVTGGTWGTNEIGATTTADLCGGAPPNDSICWYSEVYPDGTTKTFGIRTQDDCGNWEFNTTSLVSAIADSKAPTACVVYPVPPNNGSYGVNNTLKITAIVGPDVTGLDSAWLIYRIKDVGTGQPGPWFNLHPASAADYMWVHGTTLNDTLNLGTDMLTEGQYELYILTKDKAGNWLTVAEAMAGCTGLVFNWFPNPITPYFTKINSHVSPDVPGCGYSVSRTYVDTATVSVISPADGKIYTVDAWAFYWIDGSHADSTRIEFVDTVALPYTFTFSAADWPKSLPAVKLFVKITDTRNGNMGISSVDICVPDLRAPDIRISYPIAYQRVPVATTSLEDVDVKAKVLSTSYDPTSPIRVEFFYKADGATDSIKIGETGSMTAGEFVVKWKNYGLADGWYWLTATIHDDKGNFSQAPWIKVYLDGSAPLMKLTVPQAVSTKSGWKFSKTTNGGNVDLIAEITNNTVDIRQVEFFISYRDSVDLAKWYQWIGQGAPANNNSIWTYPWNITASPWGAPQTGSTTLTSDIDSDDYADLTSIYGLKVGSSITLFDQVHNFTETRIITDIVGMRVHWSGDVTYYYHATHTQVTWSTSAWMKCGFDYKLRIKVTDIAGNVYDDENGDGQFDDYTFWDKPFEAPINLKSPADVSKMLFTLDCGAPQVAISEFEAGGRIYPNPSTLLGGPGRVYAKKDDDSLTVKSVVTDSLNDLGNIEKVDYQFYSPVYNAWMTVGKSTSAADAFKVTFDPFDAAKPLIRQTDFQNEEYAGSIRAILTDNLGQTSTDVITCYILDNIPAPTKWRYPNTTFVAGDVNLQIWALNADVLKKVVYKYFAATGDTFVITTVLSNGAPNFSATWPTYALPDGDYTLAFETVDQNDNATEIAQNPRLAVKVNNALPTVAITSPDPATSPFFSGHNELQSTGALHTTLSSSVSSDDDHAHLIHVDGIENATAIRLSDGNHTETFEIDHIDGNTVYLVGSVNNDYNSDNTTVTLFINGDICNGPYFTANVIGVIGIRSVDFQWKRADAGINAWNNFNTPDNAAPWGMLFTVPATVVGQTNRGWTPAYDGFYQFRAKVTDVLGRDNFSEPITLYYDGTAPRVLIKTLVVGSDTSDTENGNDPAVTVAVGTQDLLHITGCAWDDASVPYNSNGVNCTRPECNSGIENVDITYVQTSPTQTPPISGTWALGKVTIDGCDTFTWDVSGLPIGTYRVDFNAYDKSGCSNTGHATFTLHILDVTPPVGYIAGFWKGWLYGLTEIPGQNGNVPVQFQWSGDNGATWNPIAAQAFNRAQKQLLNDGQRLWYALYSVPWNPANNDYRVRMLTTDEAGNFDPTKSPQLSINIKDGVATALPRSTSNVFGALSVEKSLESQGHWDGLEGIARMNTSYGMPFGAIASHNELTDAWAWEIVDFRKVSQQSTPEKFAGKFNVDALVQSGNGNVGGYGTGHLFVFDRSENYDTAFSVPGEVDGWWITEALGTGGWVYNQDKSVGVNVPQSWTTDRNGENNLLVITESEFPQNAIIDDQRWKPTPNDNGMVYFIGNLGNRGSSAANGWCGTQWNGHSREASVMMHYSSLIDDSRPELLTVLAYDQSAGRWTRNNINFPTWVNGGWVTDSNLVYFTTTCLTGPFAVGVQVPENCYNDIKQYAIEPLCSKDAETFTSGYPTFRYVAPQPFRNILNGATLEVKVGNTSIYTGTQLGGTGSPADGWTVNFNPTSGRIDFWMVPFTNVNGVPDILPPLSGDTVRVYVAIQDDQSVRHCANELLKIDRTAPRVHFANDFVPPNPTIEFSVKDDQSGVDWNTAHVDVYFVTKDSTNANNLPQTVYFIQTFFPGQLADYRVPGNDSLVRITTSYNRKDEQAVVVVIYNGIRSDQGGSGEFATADPSAWDEYDEFYTDADGIYDCVGNHTTPHMQYLPVDRDAPTVELTSEKDACPLTFTILDDGSGLDASSIVITEDGVALDAAQSTPAAVDAPGEWCFVASGEGGMLYYCPSNTKRGYLITVKDKIGNERTYPGDITRTVTPTSITNAWAGPNPFDPTSEQGTFRIHFDLDATADVTVKIYDMAGGLVKTIDAGSKSGSDSWVGWDGATTGGTRVANGAYLAHIEASGGGNSASAVVKIAVIEK